jgi:hypothetical protein
MLRVVNVEKVEREISNGDLLVSLHVAPRATTELSKGWRDIGYHELSTCLVSRSGPFGFATVDLCLKIIALKLAKYLSGE